MEIYKYPEVAAHKDEHRTFIEKMFNLTGHLQAHKADVPTDLFYFLWEWLSSHILVTDKKYTDTLRAAGMD
jgi:hemerythrin